ncbi:hypothetical protein [Candidatus Bathycorpusculum sp.]|jgi:hypothetical protein|uniref:hypothetical protein n=1 Tax=Candidatus Bathycorpusculum sp. TaxID=2994959 RepID=UPI0028396FD6|nr:hypothetical protein [Candidatus Termitimicrobium sp.]MCL2685396.1 hypothetical protein [Candidatus Termitimicrobium sp.]
MAYLRSENEKLEIDYSAERVWRVIPRAVKALQWEIQETDETHQILKIKTKGAFLSYGSILTVEVVPIDEKTCRMSIMGETPVTTITSMADFGRTRDRISFFVEAIAKEIETEKTGPESTQ